MIIILLKIGSQFESYLLTSKQSLDNIFLGVRES